MGGQTRVRDRALVDLVSARVDSVVAPAFSFAHEAEADPLIDPCTMSSEMGRAITEAGPAGWSDASTAGEAYRHSFRERSERRRRSGRRSITGCTPFDLRSSFGVIARPGHAGASARRDLFELDESPTSRNSCGDVPYRWVMRALGDALRRPDGQIVVATIGGLAAPTLGRRLVLRLARHRFLPTGWDACSRSGGLRREHGDRQTPACGALCAMRDLIALCRGPRRSRDYNIFRSNGRRRQDARAPG
jgi:hypothetical protein